jgi:RsiW-degrading membrane proteinase PrsW (M82 family)
MVAPKLPPAFSAWKTWVGSASVLIFYPAVVLLCFRQWASPDPWRRLDLFSGGYLVLTLALFAQQSVFADRIAGPEEIRTVFFSLEIDPGFARWSMILGLAETLVDCLCGVGLTS